LKAVAFTTDWQQVAVAAVPNSYVTYPVGASCIRNTLISEEVMVGAAAGAAMTGLCPIDDMIGVEAVAMTRGLVAGFFYFLIVGTAGIVFGVVREMFVSPALGHNLAIFIELPFLLGLSWLSCNWLVGVNGLPAKIPPRLAMSVAAFALLITMEYSLQFALQHLVAARAAAPDWRWGDYIGLAGQIAYGLFPLFATANTEPVTG
jgi:hypothetical protein